MFPGSYVPRYLFSRTYVPRYLCVPGTYVSPVAMFPDYCTLIVDFSINR